MMSINEPWFLLGNPKIDQQGSGAQSYTWTVPSGKVWIVLYATAKNASQSSNVEITISDGTNLIQQFQQSVGTAADGNYSRDFQVMVLKAGWTIKTRLVSFLAGDTTWHAIHYLEYDVA